MKNHLRRGFAISWLLAGYFVLLCARLMQILFSYCSGLVRDSNGGL